jgi:adenine deaminase
VDLLKNRTEADITLSRNVYQKELETVGAMQQAGVGILAGTDTSNPYCLPGFSLHDELGLMVQAGMTPLQALQTATINPARFLGQEENLGTVEKGKVADLVLLDANPLDNISNTNKIDAVVYGGKFFSKDSIDEMLAKVESIASKKSIAEALSKTIKEQGVEAAVDQYHDLKSTQLETYDFSERELNGLGYQLMADKKVKEGISIFEFNT